MRALALAFILLAAQAGSAQAATVRLYCGLFGIGCSQLADFARALNARGHKATVHSHFADPAALGGQVHVGHSAGADRALQARRARLVVAIDATILNPGAPAGVRTLGFYNPANALPLIFCCGGYAVKGAKNAIWRKPHVTMPGDPALQALILREIGRLK